MRTRPPSNIWFLGKENLDEVLTETENTFGYRRMNVTYIVMTLKVAHTRLPSVWFRS